ncbi:MAG: type sorting protein [Flavisolibacter sp.]|jgi:hypothetical protein|nr:type sorting protein [Flavisolibacter sp.]
MKKLYKTVVIPAIFIVLILYSETGFAQCPNGQPSGGIAFDTTVSFPVGVIHQQIKFPKFNPQNGMLSCVKLIITMTGIIDLTTFQNYAASPQTANFTYIRKDTMRGPGLSPWMTNNFSGNYGPYNLGPFDGTGNGGADFYSSTADTIIQQEMLINLSDSASISQFYGTDSAVYDYNIGAVTTFTGGGSIGNTILTSALVNFRFEYCTCPISALPVGLKNFTVAKRSASAALLQWQAEAGTDNYTYEIEVSRDGKSFSRTAVLNKVVNTTNPSYQYGYSIKANDYGRYYFRVKQRWLDGYYKYSEVKPVDFTNPLFSTISLYPNPSSGQVGIKFVSVKGGKFLVQVSNATGQVVVTKELMVAETDYKTVATLVTGMYYIKITDVATGAFCINQMVVK